MPLNLPFDSKASNRPLVYALGEDVAVLNSLKENLGQNFDVLTSSSEREALDEINELKGVEVLLVSKNLPRMKGTEFLDLVDDQIEKPETIIKIIMTESSENADKINSSYNGKINCFYAHPFDAEEIRKRIRYFLARKKEEKRTSMRVPFSDNNRLRIDTRLKMAYRIKNIAENGVFLKTHAFLPQDAILPLKILLPEGKFPVSGCIVRRDKEEKGVGIQFLSTDVSFRRAINKALAEQVTLNGLPGLKSNIHFYRSMR